MTSTDDGWRVAQSAVSMWRLAGGHGWAAPDRYCKCEWVRDASAFAQHERVGIWPSVFIMPWDWWKSH